MRPHARPAQRFGVMPLPKTGRQPWYVIFDCETDRIIDGAYAILDTALAVAARCEGNGGPLYDDMTPTAECLGLIFPCPPERRRHKKVSRAA